MNEELIKKSKILSKWIIDQTQKDSAELFKSIKNGDLDLVDHKIKIEKEATTKVFHEFLFLHLYLGDVYVYQILGDQRDDFFDNTIKEVVKTIGVDDWSAFVSTYNNRIQEFSKYKKLITETDEESPVGTLFWEFGKRIGIIIDGSPLLTIVMATKSLLTQAMVDLWSLQLFNIKK